VPKNVKNSPIPYFPISFPNRDGTLTGLLPWCPRFCKPSLFCSSSPRISNIFSPFYVIDSLGCVPPLFLYCPVFYSLLLPFLSSKLPQPVTDPGSEVQFTPGVGGVGGGGCFWGGGFFWWLLDLFSNPTMKSEVGIRFPVGRSRTDPPRRSDHSKTLFRTTSATPIPKLVCRFPLLACCSNSCAKTAPGLTITKGKYIPSNRNSLSPPSRFILARFVMTARTTFLVCP